MSLETSSIESRNNARKFWDLHFPFMLATHSDYDYLAVRLNERSFGEIVHGCGPEFEETSVVAPTFGQFLISFRETVTGERGYYPLINFV